MSQLDRAILATKHGAYAAFVSATITFLTTLFAILTEQQGIMGYFNNPIIFLELPIIVGFGIGMLKKSRLAAALAFVYHLLNQIVLRIDLYNEFNLSVTSLGVALVFLGLYARAYLGATDYHNLMKESDPEYNPATKKSKTFGSIATILMAIIIIINLVNVLSPRQSHYIYLSDDILESDYELLRSKGLITDNEHILFFFPYNLNDQLESGNIVTNERVIIYNRESETDTRFYYINRQDIRTVELEIEDFIPSVNRYKVYGEDEEVWIALFLSTKLNRHEKLISEILK